MAKREYITLDEAQELLLAKAAPLAQTERLPLLDALGRVACEDIRAAIAQPPFARSPLDGYALRHQDTKNASPENPVKLKVTQHIFAGDFPSEPLKSGEAARIMTGAMLPSGADCVLRQEDTDRGESVVSICTELKKHQNFCFLGEDAAKDTLLVSRGKPLNYADLGVAAGQGYDRLSVFRRVKAAIMSSGDELTQPGCPLEPGKIYSSNDTLLAARLISMNMQPATSVSCADDLHALCRTIDGLLGENDMVITTGGVSVGQRDLLPAAAEKLGGTILFHGISVKPGSPALAMVRDGKLLLCLSGNPFAALTTFEVLAAPVLRKLAGCADYMPVRRTGIARCGFSKSSDTRRLIRAKYTGQDVHIPKSGHASGMLSSLSGCNCLVDVPAGSPEIKIGDSVELVLL